MPGPSKQTQLFARHRAVVPDLCRDAVRVAQATQRLIQTPGVVGLATVALAEASLVPGPEAGEPFVQAPVIIDRCRSRNVIPGERNIR